MFSHSLHTAYLRLTVALFAAVLAPAVLTAQQERPTVMDQKGGRYLTAHGTVNALVVFAQFPDDSLTPGHEEWPVNSPPARFGTWIDSVWTGSPTPFSLTDYFNEMSLGAFRFIGKPRFVVAPRTRQEYLALGSTRADIHRDLFRLLDEQMDFAEFDRWDPEGEYVHVERPDGIVDMVIVIWRNVLDDIPDAAARDTLRTRLDFTYDIEDLGFGPSLSVDDGARTIAFGYGMDGTTPTGSGVTLRKPPTLLPFMSVMQTTVHEVGHYLLGWNDYHAGFGFWGMLSAYGVRCFAANSFERHRLGWISLISISNDDTLSLSNAALPDFITTGIAVRLVIDSASGQCFYLENHQRISRWDIPSQRSDERGLYVIRQDNETDTSDPIGSGHHMRLIPADGRYDWDVHRRETHSCCGSFRLPVFDKLAPNRHTGFHHNELIPFTDPETGEPAVSDVLLTEDDHGATVLTVAFSGTGMDAFRPGFATVFSPWSNPTSQDKHRNATGFAFEIIAVNPTQNGDVYVVDLFSHTGAKASPARVHGFRAHREGTHPLLLWQRNEEPDLRSYRLYRALQPTDGEPDADGYTLAVTLPAYDQSGDPVVQWTDEAVELPDLPDGRWYYAIEAVDSTGQASVRSSDWLDLSPASDVAGPGDTGARLSLSPNPASAHTRVEFALPSAAAVTIEVVTMQGTRPAAPVGAVYPAGHHTVGLDLSALPAGVYLVRVQTGATTQSRLLVRLP